MCMILSRNIFDILLEKNMQFIQMWIQIVIIYFKMYFWDIFIILIYGIIAG